MSVIDDPFTPASDATFVVPRPGAGRKGAADTTHLTRSAPMPAASDQPPGSPPPLPPAVGTGLRPLIAAAAPVLLLTGQLRMTRGEPDLLVVRQQCVDEIRRFEDHADRAGINRRTVKAASYVLCAGLDEAVLATAWGAHSRWPQSTLLLQLHKESRGGEHFFLLLQRFSEDPRQHADILELQYLCLSLGFAGRYGSGERDLTELRAIGRDTLRLVRDGRDRPPSDLSPHWRGVEDRRNPIIRYVPWWIVASAALVIVVVTFTVLRARLVADAAPVHAAIARIGDLPPAVPAPAPAGPTLRQLLADDVAAARLAIEERGNQTWVVPLAADLFASGSARVNQSHLPLLARVGRAVEVVPGRVLVNGHTDDQPIRSGIFADNFELSRERAVQVARVLEASLSARGRLSWNGLGSSRPLHHPPSTPENRARNRRVEIVHVR